MYKQLKKYILFRYFGKVYDGYDTIWGMQMLLDPDSGNTKFLSNFRGIPLVEYLPVVKIKKLL
jgi:hypothetical protein